MIAPVFLALGISALLLLAFGDMLGLPAPLVRSLALVLIGVVALGMVLLRSTARFGRFLSGDDGIHAPGAGMIAISLVGGTIFVLVLAKGVAASLVMLVFFASFAFGLALLTPPVPDAEPRFGDIQIIRALSAGLLAILALSASYPAVLAVLAQIIPLSSTLTLALGLALIGIPVIFGGMASLAALASMVLFLTLIFIMMPLLFELALTLRGAGGSALPGIALAMPALPPGLDRLMLLEPVALGFALAIAARQGFGQARRQGRLTRPIVGLVMGAGLLASGAAIWLALHNLIANDLVGKPISSWPLWAFDEALRGWITLCGRPIASHAESLRTCAQQGIAFSGPLAAERALILPGLALAKGWPVLFGILPNFIALLTLVFSTAMLLHAAIVALGSLWSLVRRRAMALRSQRLAGMRALALLILALLASSASDFLAALLSGQTRSVLLIGTILLIMVAQVAAGLRRFQHWRHRRMDRPASPLPANSLPASSLPPSILPDAA